jgi:hypothetical protein
MTMHAIIRRYEAIDQTRITEIVKKAEDSLLPRLSELPGFNSFHLIEAGNGVVSSVGVFDSAEHAEESTRMASHWVRQEHLEAALPKEPTLTAGPVVVHKTRELVEA